MKRVSMVILDGDLPVATEEMGRYGVVHLINIEEIGDWATGLDWKEADEMSSAYDSYRRRMQAVMQNLAIEGVAVREELNLIAPKMVASRVAERLLVIEAKVKRVVDREQRLQEEARRLDLLGEQLELLAPLGIDVAELRGLSFLYFVSVLVPTENLDRLRGSLARTPNVILPVKRKDDRSLVLAFSMRKDAEVLERALRSAYAQHQDIPEELVGTPVQALCQIRTRRMALARRNEEIEKSKQALAIEYRDELLRMHGQLTVNGVVVDAWRHFGATHETRLVSGWLPAKGESEFLAALSRVVGGRVVVHTEEPLSPTASHRSPALPVPTRLDNPALMKPFETLVKTYGIPNYREIDPTPLAGLLFVLMFGMMFGDVGQGAILALGGLLLAKEAVIKGNSALGWMLFDCGLTAVIFGFLYGSVFLLEEMIPALWFQPIRNAEFFISLAIVFGVAVNSLGLTINVVDAVWNRDYPRLFLDRNGLAGIWFYWGAVFVATQFITGRGVALPVVAALLGLPLLLIFAHDPLTHMLKDNGTMRAFADPLLLFQSGIEVFDAAIRYMTNTLSYIRVAAFAISHAGMGLMVIAFAAMVHQAPLAEPVVYAIGNVFVIALEGLVVAIQALRLDYYEFFTKFFKGDGIAYHPFVIPRIPGSIKNTSGSIKK
ncbi:MAG: hypothetical protein HYY30_11720 [Chloroflexi bacterium]|nr:hypothetical protein [Chloroflexota bacterium]